MFKQLDEDLHGTNFYDKSENFQICELSQKSRNFIYPGLEMCEVAAQIEKVEKYSNLEISKNVLPKSDEVEFLQ